jgi:uncharacterized protein
METPIRAGIGAREGVPWVNNQRRQAIFLDFKPLPFLGNPHVQTVLGNLWPGNLRALPTRAWQVALLDGDRLVVHDSTPAGWRNGLRLALLVHGLGGCHSSGYMVRIAWQLFRRGWRVLRLDLRGAGAGAAWARRTYNAACSEDVRAVALAVHEQAPASPLTLIGVSLGGNIVLKLAGEAARIPVPGLERVAALAPPIELERCAELLAAPRNRLYER